MDATRLLAVVAVGLLAGCFGSGDDGPGLLMFVSNDWGEEAHLLVDVDGARTHDVTSTPEPDRMWNVTALDRVPVAGETFNVTVEETTRAMTLRDVFLQTDDNYVTIWLMPNGDISFQKSAERPAFD